MESDETYAFRWRDFESNIANAFRDLREESALFDVTLGCSDSNGRILQAHKVVLSACSVFFKQTVLVHCLDNPKPFIYLKGISFKDISLILDFMYQGEVTVPKEDLDSFLSVTGELKIKGLVSKDGSPDGKEESTSPKRSGTDTPLFIAPPPKKEKDSILDSNNLDQILLEADDESFEKYLNSGSDTYKCKKCSFECKSRYRLEYHEKSHHGHQDSSEYITKAAKESSPLLIDGIESFEMNEEEDFSDEERKLKDKLNDYKELLDHNNNRTYNSQDYQMEEDYGQNGLKISPEPTSNVKEEITRDEVIKKSVPIFTSEKGNLKLHLIKQHFDGTDRCTCTECDRVFSSYRSAKQHLEIVHNDSPIFYECTICHKVIKSKQMFRIHALNKHEIRGKKILSTYGKEVGEAEYLKQK